MIKFKPDMLRVEIYDMKSCTTALGGSMRIVKDGAEDEACTRIPVPLAVARQFKVRYKTSKYIKPVLVAAVYYGESIIALLTQFAKLPAAKPDTQPRQDNYKKE